MSIAVKPALHLLQHPFYRAWMEGSLTRAQLQDYARQYFAHVDAFPGYLSNAMKLCEKPAAEAILAENLAEEDGTTYGTSHPELWLRFAEGLGTSRAEVLATQPRNGVNHLVSTFDALTRRSLPAALGALYAYESQVPEIAQSKIEGLKANFHVHDERTLAFFEVHKSADVEHRESIRALIEELNPVERAEAQAACDEACQALWGFLSDAYEPAA